jgi:hypothetical protein
LAGIKVAGINLSEKARDLAACTLDVSTARLLLELADDIESAQSDNYCMSQCLIVMSEAEVGAGSLRTAAYDVALNCIDADILRTRFAL